MKLTNMVRKSNSGFSLIELMVVVAIIGILAAIGIPQYAKFQAKARQSEAKAQLGTLFAAETSFFGDQNQYSTDLRNVGFGVQGTNLRYITGFPGITGSVCSGYSAASSPAEATGNIVSYATAVNTAGATWVYGAVTTTNPTIPTTGTLPSDCQATTSFRARSYGSPRNTFSVLAADQDLWTIDQNKLIGNPQVGI